MVKALEAAKDLFAQFLHNCRRRRAEGVWHEGLFFPHKEDVEYSLDHVDPHLIEVLSERDRAAAPRTQSTG